MKYFALIALIAASAFLQQSHAQESTRSHNFDCTTLPPGSKSQGCQSYNEMVTKGDKDLVNLFNASTPNDVVVCFRPDEDLFFIISYNVPSDTEYRPNAAKNELQVFSFLSYSRYKDGVLDTAGYSFGKWSKIPNFNIPATFAGQGKDNAASISDSEASYSSTFQNLSNTKTNYSVQVRLSTLRFSESYTFQETLPPTKPGKAPAPAPPPTSNRIGYSGYCAHFPPTSAN